MFRLYTEKYIYIFNFVSLKFYFKKEGLAVW